MRQKITFIIVLLNLIPLVAQKDLTVEKIWSNYEFMSRGSGSFKWQPSGTKYTKLSNSNGQQSIIEYDITKGQEYSKVIADLSALNKLKLLVQEYNFSPDQQKVLLATQKQSIYRHSYEAVFYILDLKTNQLTALDNQNSPQTLPLFSPKNDKIAYIAGRNLFYKDLNTNKIVAITKDGAYNEIINGTTDWVYEEEFAITQAFDWSPDGEFIAYLKFDESDVKEFTMNYYGELYPTPYTFKYPKAGEKNSEVTANIYSLNKETNTVIVLDSYEYIPRINWSTTQNTLLLQTLNRHQNNLLYYKVEQKENKWIASVFHKEESDTYINVDDNLHFFKDGKSILRTSEKDGFNHIYKIDFDGKTTQLTTGNWDVIDLYGLNDANTDIFFTAAKQGAIHQGIYKLDLKKNKIIAISDEYHKNTAQFTADKKFFIKNSSTANTPNEITLCDHTGKQLHLLSNNELLQKRITKHEFAPKTFKQIALEGRTLNTWIILPNSFDSSKQYPVFINIYGGPGSNMVYDGWDNNMAFHQLLAQEGYIVMSVDPRGTQYNGAKFKKSTYLNLGKLETQDFIDFAKHIGEWNFVDKSRIGIQGWSYGGFMAANCMTKGDGVFKVGIAVAPVTNWKYYDNIYTERYMRTPQENQSGYDENSPINSAGNLKGKFLLIHGAADDNVHYQNTLELVDALVNANKQFDLFIYPNKDHSIVGGNARNHLFQMILNYVNQNL